MDLDFKNELQKIGFSLNEASVYIALLSLGSATNSQIARESKLNRITNFEVLKRLGERGVVSGFKMRGVMYFGALNPEILIKERKSNLDALEKGLVDMAKNKNNEKRPKVSLVSGKDGLKRIYEESLLAKGEILTFTNSKDIRAYFGDNFVDNYVKSRVKRGIKVRGFAPNNQSGQKDMEDGLELLREVKLVLENRSISNEIMIFDDKVVLFSTSDEMGIVIKNKSISESLKTVWEILWSKS